MERSSGILLPVAALPGRRGIGSLGAPARAFVDFLAKSRQRWWQMLPVGPTSYGDSPYQSPSSFAGNPYLIDVDQLVDEGLLIAEEVDAISWGDDPACVDYALLYHERLPLLRKAYERGKDALADELAAFWSANAAWLDDYALFMAIKREQGMVSWIDWDDEGLRLRDPGALWAARERLADDIAFEAFVQMLFFRQWDGLHAYARERGVKLLGDLPIYVALDSADVWAAPEYFQLDEKNVPIEVAGVPPDAFTADGQLWGNPLYDYDKMEEDGFGWWIRRLGGAARLYDAVRIDHFRGFESYWAVPFDAKTAKDGRWVKGPGMKLVGVLASWFQDLTLIAEDLGYLTPEARQLLADSGLPGMKVLEFAFDSRDTAASAFLPHVYGRSCVCYVGTHDNMPIMGWLDDADPGDVEYACTYLGLSDEEGFSWGFIRAGMGSVADLFVAQMQDYLGLGAESRTNEPGTLGCNWKWRLAEGQLTDGLAARIARMTSLYGRSA